MNSTRVTANTSDLGASQWQYVACFESYDKERLQPDFKATRLFWHFYAKKVSIYLFCFGKNKKDFSTNDFSFCFIAVCKVFFFNYYIDFYQADVIIILYKLECMKRQCFWLEFHSMDDIKMYQFKRYERQH